MKVARLSLTFLAVLCGCSLVHAVPEDIFDDADTVCDPANYAYPVGLNPFRGDPAISIYAAVVFTSTPGITAYETPIAIRTFALIAAVEWGCMAAYDVGKLDALRTGERPIVEVPATVCGGTVDAHVTSARAMCLAYGYGAVLPTLAPGALEGFQQGLDLLSTDFSSFPPTNTGAFANPFPTGIHPLIQECDDAATSDAEFKICVNAVAALHNYKPEIVASALAADMLRYAKDDGFNQDGTNNGTCEYNCRPYADTSGYFPVNIPGAKKTTKGQSSIKRRWQPLLEDDGLGFFYRQEHVTPHIGTQAKPRTITPEELASREVDDPGYDLRQEARKAVERMESLLTSDPIGDRIKMQIELFDDKTNVIALFGRAFGIRYGRLYTLERVILFCTVYVASEHDAVLLSWKEKVRHDLVRPTTVVQQSRTYSTPETVTTWAGPGNGIQTFAAKDFQPYKRVMPHAEFPSGSGCICTANMEMVQVYMKIVFNDNIGLEDPFGSPLFASFDAGESNVEPGITPASDIVLNYGSLKEVRDACGSSRLDGGMHFEAAVPQSYELCAGLGSYAETYLLGLLGGTTDLITTFVPGPPGPPAGPSPDGQGAGAGGAP